MTIMWDKETLEIPDSLLETVTVTLRPGTWIVDHLPPLPRWLVLRGASAPENVFLTNVRITGNPR